MAQSGPHLALVLQGPYKLVIPQGPAVVTQGPVSREVHRARAIFFAVRFGPLHPCLETRERRVNIYETKRLS